MPPCSLLTRTVDKKEMSREEVLLEPAIWGLLASREVTETFFSGRLLPLTLIRKGMNRE